MIEVVDNRDGTLSIFGTMVDHEGGSMLSLARELMANDPHAGFAHGGTGEEPDRNVELLLPHPFAGGSDESAAILHGKVAVPASGIPTGLTIGGELAVVGGRKLIELRDRGARLANEETSSVR